MRRTRRTVRGAGVCPHCHLSLSPLSPVCVSPELELSLSPVSSVLVTVPRAVPVPSPCPHNFLVPVIVVCVRRAKAVPVPIVTCPLTLCPLSPLSLSLSFLSLSPELKVSLSLLSPGCLQCHCAVPNVPVQSLCCPQCPRAVPLCPQCHCAVPQS